MRRIEPVKVYHRSRGKPWQNIFGEGRQMSIFKNFLKYKKDFYGEFDVHPLEKPLMHDKVYEYHHKKAVLENEMLYDTETAKRIFADESSMEYISLGVSTQRVYFLTPNGRWFSAKEEIETESGITDVGEYRTQVTKKIFVYDNLRMEKTHRVKDLIGKNDYELYKQYFGEVEEA